LFLSYYTQRKLASTSAKTLIILLFFLEYDDECVTASEIYSCGREKEPTIVNAIFNTEKGNATVVCNMSDTYLSK